MLPDTHRGRPPYLPSWYLLVICGFSTSACLCRHMALIWGSLPAGVTLLAFSAHPNPV